MTGERREVTRPIRIIVGIGSNLMQGFAAVYEKSNGTAGSINVWFDEPTFLKVRFADDGGSRIVFAITRDEAGDGESERWEVKEVVIYRSLVL